MKEQSSQTECKLRPALSLVTLVLNFMTQSQGYSMVPAHKYDESRQNVTSHDPRNRLENTIFEAYYHSYKLLYID